jgi:hypothetical protein
MSVRATLGYGRNTGLPPNGDPAETHSDRTSRASPAAVRSSISLRRATIADSEALARNVIQGLKEHASFAPPGWSLPLPEDVREDESLADENVYCFVAEYGGELVGHVTCLPAARTGTGAHALGLRR